MVSMDQVKNGLIRYIESDIMPHLDGIKKIGVGLYTGLAADNAVKMALQYANHPAIAMLNVIDEAGNVDIDKLYKTVIPMFNDGHKEAIKVPLVGEFRIDKNDIETLYRYIRV